MMRNIDLPQLVRRHGRCARIVATVVWLCLATVVVRVAWNSFAVLELELLQFKEALGLTLLVSVAGQLLSPGRRHAHGRHRNAP